MKNQIKYLVLFIAFSLCSINLFSQDESDTITYDFNGYKIVAMYDTSTQMTTVNITKGGKLIDTDTSYDRVFSMKDYDLEGNKKKELVIERYTGGAHCCTYIMAGAIDDDGYEVYDTLFWGDSGFDIQDLNKDGVMEISGVDTRFGYAFTNFADSKFPVLIYRFLNGKFVNITKKFPALVQKDIDDYKEGLKEDFPKGFDCPKKAGDETFNTDAGSVKAYLAAIMEDYYNLGKVLEGYSYIEKVYQCPDARNFIYSLKDDYGLK